MTVSDTRVPAPISSSNAAKRRTQRVQIAMPIRVTGGVGENAFDELAETATVSAHGCLLRLKGIVARLDELLIVNPATQQQVLGTVVFVGESKNSPREVGVEFAVPSPLFWGITFPPTDWDPSERKLPSNASHQPAVPKPRR
jgi:PilZ domain-containing protein